MCDDLPPETDLLHPMPARELTRRTGPQVDVIVVEGARLPQLIIRAGAHLLVDIWKALLTKGAVVEPIIAAPAIHHGIHGHGYFERWMRIDHCSQSQKSIVGDAEHADLAVRFGGVFYQPIDGVVGIGRFIHRGWIERSAHRARHDVIALTVVLATDVLDHSDISAFDDGLD